MNPNLAVTVNKDLFTNLISTIQEKSCHFDMAKWMHVKSKDKSFTTVGEILNHYQEHKEFECGTVFCVAGFTVLLGDQQKLSQDLKATKLNTYTLFPPADEGIANLNKSWSITTDALALLLGEEARIEYWDWMFFYRFWPLEYKGGYFSDHTRDVQREQAIRLLTNLRDNPEQFHNHCLEHAKYMGLDTND